MDISCKEENNNYYKQITSYMISLYIYMIIDVNDMRKFRGALNQMLYKYIRYGGGKNCCKTFWDCFQVEPLITHLMFFHVASVL